MITTTVKETSNQPKRNYPYIGEDTGTYVLFTEPEKGIVIAQEDTECSYVVGHYSKNWAERCFTVFEGEITLKNS